MSVIRQVGDFSFCFFNRNGGVSSDSFCSLNCSFNQLDKKENVLQNRKIVKQKFYVNKEIILVNQVHSNKVVFVDKSFDGSKVYADAMITDRKDILLGILTADCAPIVVISKKKFAIIHAGWKGVFSGIIENTIKELYKRGENIKDMQFFVGPHLKKKSFEIKDDFIQIMRKKTSNYLIYISKRKNKKFFDFSCMIEDILQKQNVKSIEISNEDTFTNSKKFFSYRFYIKKGIKNCGRQISLVGIKD